MKRKMIAELSVVDSPFQVGLFACERSIREGRDADYIFGISEIDAQHEEVERILIELQESVDVTNRGPVDHPILARLYERLKFHFALEEAVMHFFSRPDTQEHSRVHGEILESLEKHMNNNRAGLTAQNRIKQSIQLVCEQIRGHDVGFLRDMNALRDRLLRAQDNTLT